MAWTTPVTWATNDTLTASVLNTHLRDNLNFLYTPPSARVYNNADLAITNNVETPLTFNSELYDTSGMHSTSVNTDRLTATSAGKYHVTMHVAWASNSTGTRVVKIVYNGSTTVASHADNPGTTGEWTQALSTVWAMAAGDYFTAVVFQNSGGSLNVSTLNYRSPNFAAVWVGN